MLVRIELSIESKMVKTEITEKIPMVIPSKDKPVRVLLTIIACRAKIKLSFRFSLNTLSVGKMADCILLA